MMEMIMNTKVFYFSICFSVLLMLTVAIVDRLAYAQQGCCKQGGVNGWYSNGLNFSDCQDLNSTRDGDDVFEKSGSIWWDVNC
jgi:hypothetical protein